MGVSHERGAPVIRMTSEFGRHLSRVDARAPALSRLPGRFGSGFRVQGPEFRVQGSV